MRGDGRLAGASPAGSKHADVETDNDAGAAERRFWPEAGDRVEVGHQGRQLATLAVLVRREQEARSADR